MGELILHIGTMKTGTTSLQRFFFENRKRLAMHGVHFPVFSEQPGTPQITNGYHLNRYCVSLAKGSGAKRRVKLLRESLKELPEAFSSHDRILLTDECISIFSSWFFDEARSANPYWPILAQLLGDAGADYVTIVVYLRRQDDWIASHWRQDVKAGYQDRGVVAHSRQRETCQAADYASILTAAEEAFDGAARIVARRYDRASFEGGTIYSDFCSACSIPWDDAYRIPGGEENASLSFDVAEALREFKSAAPPNTPLREDVLIPLAARLSDKDSDAPDMTPFDANATRSLMEPYLEGNGRISERYLDGEPLFSEEYGGRPVWVPNEEHIAEYRAIFQETIRQHAPQPGDESALRGFAHKLPEGLRRLLGAIRSKLPRP